MSLLLPPTVEQTGYLLRVRCYSVDGLPKMNSALNGSPCDPYVAVEFGGLVMKTKHGKGQKWDWNEELSIPVMEPVMASTIKISVYDWDRIGKDNLIGTFQVEYNDVKQAALASGGAAALELDASSPTSGGGSGGGGGATKDHMVRWFNLYGAPRGRQRGKQAKKMNAGSLPGSFNRGRVLLGFHVSRFDNPKKNNAACTPLTPSTGAPQLIKYAVQFDVYEGSEIPESQRTCFGDWLVGWDLLSFVSFTLLTRVLCVC